MSSAGDACAVIRVHQFLEHWRIINNDSASTGTPSVDATPQSTADVKAEPVAVDAAGTAGPSLPADPPSSKRQRVEMTDDDSSAGVDDGSCSQSMPIPVAIVAAVSKQLADCSAPCTLETVDWEKVASAVGNGWTSRQCMQRFMGVRRVQ